MEFDERFELESNPFRVTPATSPDEIVWAGFPEIKGKIKKRIKRSIRIPNSSLVLNWGEYGSGKTHAARYFNKEDVLGDLGYDDSIPYSMVMALPKGKEPVYNIFISIIDKLNISEIRIKFEEADVYINDIIDDYGDNLQIQNVLKAIFDSEVDENLLKKYLYGSITNVELKKLNDYDILRKLNSDSDYTKLISGLFTCLTYQKDIYSLVIMWIDEFEDIAVLSSSNIDKTNNFLREIMDGTPNNLLVFLNLTQSALISVEDLGEYLNGAVRSRIREINNFELPSPEAFKDYFIELIALYRIGDSGDKYSPFTEGAVDYLISKLENVSLRRFNDAFSLLLEIADMEDVSEITEDFIEENEREIIWKDL